MAPRFYLIITFQKCDISFFAEKNYDFSESSNFVPSS